MPVTSVPAQGHETTAPGVQTTAGVPPVPAAVPPVPAAAPPAPAAAPPAPPPRAAAARPRRRREAGRVIRAAAGVGHGDRAAHQGHRDESRRPAPEDFKPVQHTHTLDDNPSPLASRQNQPPSVTAAAGPAPP